MALIRRGTLLSGWLVLVLLAPSAALAAKKPEDVFAGKIFIMKKRLPEHYRNAQEFIAAVKRSEVGTLWPEDASAKEKSWRFEYIAFFRKPLDDREIRIKIIDITDGAPRLMPNGIIEQQIMSRGERSFGSSLTLGEKEEFEMNKRYRMVIESRGRVIASTVFILRAAGPRYSGKVEFSEEEAKGR